MNEPTIEPCFIKPVSADISGVFTIINHVENWKIVITSKGKVELTNIEPDAAGKAFWEAVEYQIRQTSSIQ